MIVVHPWAIDDGQGWRTPEPAGVAFQCTPAKNKIVLDHAATVINPFLKSLRGKAAWSPTAFPARKTRSARSSIDRSRAASRRRSISKARSSSRPGWRHSPIRARRFPALADVSTESPTIAYFKQFPGLDAGPAYEGKGSGSCRFP